MPISAGAQIKSGPSSAKVGENISVTSHHTARVANTTGNTVQCKITFRIGHDRGSAEFKNSESKSLAPGESFNTSADGVLPFSPKVSGPHRMVAETIIECGTLGSDAAKSSNWDIQVSLK